ncbi:MAG: xanthine dehydrogenase molybdopterin binding subunit [Acidobacteria bacterium]|nr:MAG: xanthine dehydrogenase molybdopterin binding subunit [Acidobacteriota bacterium]
MSAVGKDVPHDSARGHVTGESIYVDDVPPLFGELVVDFVWSPYSKARIVSLDLSEARKLAYVYTHEDLHHNRLGPIVADEPLLVDDGLCTFRGQPIVVVAAETRAAVDAAKRAVRIEFEELKPILTIDDAIAAQSFIGETRYIRRGDAEAAIASAEHVIEGVFFNQGQDHFYLESQAAIVQPGENGAMHVLSSTQHPTEVQEVIAHLLGLQMNQVVVTTKRMGGAFGGKEAQATHPATMAALVSQKTKRPTRIVYDKDTDMHVTGKRHAFQNRYRVGFTRSGEIVGMKVEFFSDGGAYADLSPAVMARAMTHAENSYYIANMDIRGTVCRTNTPPNTAFRGFGGPQGVATMENVVEEIAAFLKKDALDVRRVNCYGVETRNTTPYGEVVPNNTLPRLLTELPERCDYRARVDAVRAFNASSQTQLKGIALSTVKFGISFNTKFLNQANALVNIYLDGSVQVSTGATEMGQGVNTKIAQLVADELHIPYERVTVMITSTEKNNNTSASAASSAADLNGSAAADGARRIRERLDELESRIGKQETWEKLVKAAYHERVSLGERGFYATPRLDWDWTSGQGTPFLYYTMGTACSEVLIDRFTGDLKVLRSDVLMDIGKPINPGIDRGQLVGAFIQGMGWVTTEDLRYDEKGVLLSHSPTTYKIPNINDLPEVFNMDWIDVENPINVGGSKAVGEPPLLMAISIWCAVKNALQFVANGDIARLKLPATNEEILMRLTEYAKRGAAVA